MAQVKSQTTIALVDGPTAKGQLNARKLPSSHAPRQFFRGRQKRSGSYQVMQRTKLSGAAHGRKGTSKGLAGCFNGRGRVHQRNRIAVAQSKRRYTKQAQRKRTAGRLGKCTKQESNRKTTATEAVVQQSDHARETAPSRDPSRQSRKTRSTVEASSDRSRRDPDATEAHETEPRRDPSRRRRNATAGSSTRRSRRHR